MSTSAHSADSLLGSRNFRLGMFGALYFVQGSALAYFRNFQTPYLDSFGIDVDAIGWFTAALLLPFVLKVFIGMLSDRVNLFGAGHRKPYIILGLVGAAVGFGLGGFFNPGVDFLPFGLLILLGSFSVAVFDSTADGFAVDVTPEPEQGTVQGTMTAGRAMGFVLLSLLFGVLFERQQYIVMFASIGAAMLLPMVWVARVQEPDDRPPERSFEWSALRSMVQPAFMLFGLYSVVYAISAWGVDSLVTFFLTSNFDAAGTVVGTYGALRGIGAIVGALAAAAFFVRIGRIRSGYIAALLVAAGAVIVGLAPSANVVLWLGLVWGFVWAFQETVFVALAMRLSDSRTAASAFALLMALSNIGVAVGQGVGTGLTDNIPFRAVFFILAATTILIFPLLWGIKRLAPTIDS